MSSYSAMCDAVKARSNHVELLARDGKLTLLQIRDGRSGRIRAMQPIDRGDVEGAALRLSK